MDEVQTPVILSIIRVHHRQNSLEEIPRLSWKLKVCYHVRFEVFTTVTMKNAVYWDVAPCSSCVNRRFGGTYRLHLRGRKIHERRTSVSRQLQIVALSCSPRQAPIPALACYLLAHLYRSFHSPLLTIDFSCG
jgi:hypothetical protein